MTAHDPLFDAWVAPKDLAGLVLDLEAPSPEHSAQALARAGAAWELGAVLKCGEFATQGRDIAVQQRERRELAVAYLWLARVEVAQGQAVRAMPLIEKAVGILGEGAGPSDALLLAATRAEWALAHDDSDERLYRRLFLDQAESEGNAWWRLQARQHAIRATYEDGDARAARRQASAALVGSDASSGSSTEVGPWWTLLAAAGETQRARECLDRLLERIPSQREVFLSRPDRVCFLRRLDAVGSVGSTGGRPEGEREMRRAFRLLRDLFAERDTSRGLRLALDALVEVSGAEEGLLVLDGQADVAVRRDASGRELDAGTGPFPPSLARSVKSAGRSVLLPEGSLRGTQGAAIAPSLRSNLGVPLRGRRQVQGAVLLGAREEGAFDDRDRDSIQRLADALAVLFDEPGGRRAFVPASGDPASMEWDRLLASRFGPNLLSILTRVLDAGEDLQGPLDRALQATVEATGADRGFALLFGEGESVRIRSAFHLPEEEMGSDRFRISLGVLTRTIREGRPVRVGEVASDPGLRTQDSVQGLGLTSLLAVPIPVSTGIAGMLYLDSAAGRHVFDAEDEALLVRFAGVLGRALEASLSNHQRAVEVQTLERALAAAIKELRSRYRFDALIGDHARMRELRTLLDHIVRFPYPVLVLGETGTGKELVAKAIHANSPRKDRPLVAVNAAALPKDLLESELFGHVRGAFTGATQERQGLFRAAHGGTLFLDEIGETPEDLQRKLLRVLQEGEFVPVGGTTPQRCDVRVVAATNRDLEEEVRQGRFREDLYYRLKVFKVVLPPLRERPEDILLLARHLLDKTLKETGGRPCEIAPETAEALARYSWPGNVRELENAMRHAVAFCGDFLLPEHLPSEVLRTEETRNDTSASESSQLPQRLDDAERAMILKTLEENGWVQTLAAKKLGISRVTLYRKLKAYGIRPPSTE